jgi:hypothetical protein
MDQAKPLHGISNEDSSACRSMARPMAKPDWNNFVTAESSLADFKSQNASGKPDFDGTVS